MHSVMHVSMTLDPHTYDMMHISMTLILHADACIFFYWPLGDGAPWGTTQYLILLGLDKYFRDYMAGRVAS